MGILLLLLGLLASPRSSESFNLDASRPIIYEAPGEGGGGGYFGTSVAIRPKAASCNGSWTIQIGAPRGGAGAVYRCRTFGPCRAFAVDEGLEAAGGRGAYEFREKKDGAWVGVAMDIKDFGSHEASVVCGHRWMNQNLKNPENIDVTYLVTGVCYIQNLFGEAAESPVERLLPLLNKDNIYTPRPYVVDLSTYHWGLGQAGISVKLSEENRDLMVIGAPGVTHWIGSVVRYKKNLGMAVGGFARTEISRRSRYPYLGYSVTFGRFYKDRELWYVAGAPRSANYRGQVFTFQFKLSTDPGLSDDVNVRSTLTGATFGEYFGSSLATADINGDGFDDLIVGAPLFSDKDPDEGRIYVYLGTNRGNFLVPGQIVEGRAGQSRFGVCVASVGDLDRDGYDDVAVGAPREDGGKGAVYIFGGFPQGLKTDRGQRIPARDIHPHLRGFGISVSPPADVDGNKYLDIAVGSYLSGHVVLLRSRPVISLHPGIKTENASLIDRKDSYVNVTVCSRYSGPHAPEHLEVTRVVDIDPIYGRGHLDPKTSLRTKTLRLRPNQILCEVLPVLLNVSGNNFSPLQITVKNEVAPCSTGRGTSLLIKGEEVKEADDFPKTCPLGNKAEASREISFAGVCGADLACRSELELSCRIPEFRGGVYTVGSTETIVLSMMIKNRGEPAFDVKIKIWANLKLKHRDEPWRTYWLHHDGILVEDYQTDFTFRIDLEEASVEMKDEKLKLGVEIFTSSLEGHLGNNKCTFSVKLRSDAILDLQASSSLASAHIAKSSFRHGTLNVTHFYEVQKSGVTPLKEVELVILLPVRFDTEILTFEVETSEWMEFSRRVDEMPKISKNIALSMKQGIPGETCPPVERTLFLNCSTPGVDCEVLRIYFTKEIPVGLSSYVNVIVSLNVTALDSVKMEKDIIYLSTTGVVRFFGFLGGKTGVIERSASVTLYNEERTMRVDAHVIALSILAGGFLLSLIVTALVKKNFFKRAKKQELKALREADASFVYFAGISSGMGRPKTRPESVEICDITDLPEATE